MPDPKAERVRVAEEQKPQSQQSKTKEGVSSRIEMKQTLRLKLATESKK